MNTERKTRIITKSDEVRAKIVPSDYNKAGVKRITIYIGKDVYNDFFTKQEQKKDIRVKLDLKEDGKLVLRKTRYPEGAKLCLQGRGTYGTYKIMTTLPLQFDYSTLPSSNHAFNFNFIKEFGIKSLELIPQTVNKKTVKNTMVINKKSLAPKDLQIRLKVNKHNKTFRLYFSKAVYDKFIVKNSLAGRVIFHFPKPHAVGNKPYFVLERVTAGSVFFNNQKRLLGHKIVKNDHSSSYTLMGNIPEYWDDSLINPENHIVNYVTAELAGNVVAIYPQTIENLTNKKEPILQHFKFYTELAKDSMVNELSLSIPNDDHHLTKQYMEENIMSISPKELNKRINELEKNQQEMFGGLIEKFNNTTQEVLKSVLENELADIRNTISAKNNDIDEKLIAKANDMFQGILDNILQKELEVIKEQIKGNEKDIKDILKELVKISHKEKESWFSRIFG